MVVVARDGVGLAGDLYLPSGPGPFPVILGRTPYNKVLGVGFGREGARRGYAVVMQDTRGRFASKGENLPFHSDVTDGADTLLWIGRQDWSNGRVGTWGGSAGAITQFQLMAAGQGGVESQHLVVGAPNLYEVVYTGGVFRKSLIEDWIRASRFQQDAVARWVAHPVPDDYWRERDASRHYGTVQAAAVHIGGYWDIFAQATIDGFNGYQHQGGKGARGRQKLVLGPWTHGVLQEKAGELTWATSVVFNRGHRIRVQIASSSSPGYDPNPNTGEPLRKGAGIRMARNRVHVGAGQASHVLLPVVKGTLR